MNIVKRKTTTKKMKGGKESEGATGMPSQFYGAKMPSKVVGASSVQPNDSAVQHLAPYKVGGKKAAPKKKPATKKPKAKKPMKKKGGMDSPIKLPALLDITKDIKGFPGLSGDSKIGGKKAAPKKKPAAKKPVKKVAPKKKPATKKPVKKAAPKKKPATKKPVKKAAPKKKPATKKPVKKAAPKKKPAAKKTVKK